MISRKEIKKIEKIAKLYFEDSSACHDWSHVERVKNLALEIGKRENADLQVLEVAALLHDVGRKQEFKQKGKKECGVKFCHAQEGAKEAEKILTEYNIDSEKIENIIHCIISHRFRNKNTPETIEAKVLFDADKLDSIGAVGVGRAFVFVGHFNTSMYSGCEKKLLKKGENCDFTKDDTAYMEYEKKLKYVKDKIQTKTGKKMAKKRHDFMVQFFERFLNEVSGTK